MAYLEKAVMEDLNSIDKMKTIFADFFTVTQLWKNIGDRYLKADQLTTMQWLLMSILVNYFKNPPTLSETADIMGSSRQNVKQIALKLEKEGFIQLMPDKEDRRIQRLQYTEKSAMFWAKRMERDNENFAVLFTGLTEDEIDMLYLTVRKLAKQSAKMNSR